MIRTPTTFVIGAGAGFAYTLPLGKDLLAEAKTLRPEHPVYQLICNGLGIHPDRIRRVIKDIQDTPIIESLDDYIAKRQDDGDAGRIGRALIAGLMGQAIAAPNRMKIDAEDWLRVVLEWMAAGAYSR